MSADDYCEFTDSEIPDDEEVGVLFALAAFVFFPSEKDVSVVWRAQKMIVFVPSVDRTRMLEDCIAHIKASIPNAVVRVVGKEVGNIGQARSFMCNSVAEPFFCMVDSDVIVTKEWYKQVSMYMKDPKVGAVYCKKLTRIPGLRAFEVFNYSQQVFPVVNSGRLDTACVILRTVAVKGFRTDLNSLEDMLLGEHIISRGYRHVMVDYVVLHLGYGGSVKGFYKALLKDGKSLRLLHRAKLHKLFFSLFVMPMKIAQFRFLTFKVRLMILVGWLF